MKLNMSRRPGRVRGIISMLTEVSMSNLFGSGTPRPPSPYRNFGLPDQPKSLKVNPLCYGIIQEFLFKHNTAWIFDFLKELTLNHKSLWHVPYFRRSKNVPHCFFGIVSLSPVSRILPAHCGRNYLLCSCTAPNRMESEPTMVLPRCYCTADK